MDEDEKEHVLRFLHSCVSYADESIERKMERGESDDVIAQWKVYREFTAYAASEVQRGDLNDWFGTMEDIPNLDLSGGYTSTKPLFI